jgi:hypothetical protein
MVTDGSGVADERAFLTSAAGAVDLLLREGDEIVVFLARGRRKR